MFLLDFLAPSSIYPQAYPRRLRRRIMNALVLSILLADVGYADMAKIGDEMSVLTDQKATTTVNLVYYPHWRITALCSCVNDGSRAESQGGVGQSTAALRPAIS